MNKNRSFDARDIKIATQVMEFDKILKLLETGIIDINDPRQTKKPWSTAKMSRLIESILVRMPLASFYIDVSNHKNWIVINNLQIFTSIKKFVIDKSFSLEGLEILKDLNGKNYNDVSSSYLRTLHESTFLTYQIEDRTPADLRDLLIERIINI